MKQKSEFGNPSEFYQQLTDSLEDYAVFTLAKTGVVTSWNKGANRVLGYSENEIIGKNFSVFFTPEDQKKRAPQKELNAAATVSHGVDDRWHVKKDGSRFWASGLVFPLKDAGGKLQGFTKVMRDLTERKRAAEFIETKLMLASIVESSDDAIIGISMDGITLSWNKGAQSLYGYTADEVVGLPISLLMPPDRKDDFPKIIKQLGAGKKIEHYETKRVSKDGRAIDVALTVSPLRDQTGKLVGASKIARDITERKRAEKGLQILSEASKILASSLDYQKTLQSVAQILVPHIADWCAIEMVDTATGEIQQLAVVHKDPKKVKWAKELRKVTPIDMNAANGVPKVIRTGKSEFYPVITDEMLSGAIKDEKHLEMVRNIGFSSVMIVPLSVQKKTIGALQLVSTESKIHFTKADLSLAEELAVRASLAIENARLYSRAQNEIAERKRLERQKDDFISIASHELKTPVTSIKAYEQVLQHHFKARGEEFAVTQLIKMDTQIDKLTTLISDLLDVTKIEAGRMTFNQEKYDFDSLVKELIDEIQRTTTKHKLILEGKTEKTVIGDRDRTGQVITNLITNAIKYSPHHPEIVISLSPAKNNIMVCVKDSGIGVPKAKQTQIFERFFRVSGPKQHTFPGLGLGLYISSEIVKRQGGRIWVESKGEDGKGSTFCFTLPCKSRDF